MSSRLSDKEIQIILNKSLSNKLITKEEATALMKVPIFSKEMYDLCYVANKLSRDQFKNKGEVHAQVGLDFSPCANDCKFCVFGSLDQKAIRLSPQEVVERAKAFQDAGANAIYLMTTGSYDFKEFISIGKKVKAALLPTMPLVANIYDFGAEQAEDLAKAGFTAIYHAIRLREGKDTKIDPKKRIQTIKNAQKAGLDSLFCIEPIGPEHAVDEIVDLMFLGKELRVTFSGAMKRVCAPGTPLHKNGEISYWELAKTVAVSRLVMGKSALGHCTHEPNMPSLLAGANLIWAETGPNPRDAEKETSKSRGLAVLNCRKILWESGFEQLEGPSPSALGSLRKQQV